MKPAPSVGQSSVGQSSVRQSRFRQIGVSHIARWGLFLTALITAMGLVASAASSYFLSIKHSRLMARGQGELYMAALRGRLGEGQPSSAQLAAMLEEQQETGLRAIQLHNPEGRLLAEAGQSLGTWSPRQGRDVFEEVGNRMRLVIPMPGRRPGPAAQGRRAGARGLEAGEGASTGSAQPIENKKENGATSSESASAGSPDMGKLLDEVGEAGILGPPPRPGGPPPWATGRRPPPRPREGPPPFGPPDRPPPGALDGPPGGTEPPDKRAGPLSVSLEYEPVLAQQLETSAWRTLLASSAGGVILLLAVLVFWRLNRRATEAEGALRRGQELATLGQLSAVLAHEIRNPLASLKGHAQLLEERLAAGSKEREKATQVVKEALRLQKLSNDLLDFVRLGEVARELVSPAALLEEAAQAVGLERCELQVEDAPVAWPLDPLRMHQVLTNLIQNAVQASPEGSPVQVSARLAGENLVFAVKDAGEGIPSGEEERIFEPFHTRRARGVGLGLAVARRLVELHGGQIQARNHPQGGAEFTVTLPPAPAED